MIAFVLFLSYLIGSIPFALIIGKVFYGVDVREHGSGNLGGTNTFRTLGKRAGFAVTIADILKGTLATSLPLLLGADIHPIICGLLAMIGHSYPVFANFKGGKAVATSAGILLFVEPVAFVIGMISFFLFLKITKYVSLSSILSSITFSLYVAISTDDLVIGVFTIFIPIFLIYKHRSNLSRIKNKTEPKVTWI